MSKKNITSQTSRVIGNADETEGLEEHEIVAHVTLPDDGGWGWVVVASSFTNIFILDGITFTFGALLPDMAHDLNQSLTLITLINSTTSALYLLASPLASALINRFGFRQCIMTGSIICSFSLLTTYFSTKYAYIFLFYGVFSGIGCALINMSASLVVGFYFERRRAMAMAIASCGSSGGSMTFFPANTYFVKLAGWRTTTLLHSGLIGLIFFLGMSYRPLLTLTVTKAEEDQAQSKRTVAYLPSTTNTASERRAAGASKIAVSHPAERLFNAVSNINYPTAAAVVTDPGNIVTSTPYSQKPSTSAATAPSRSKIVLTPNVHTDGTISQRHIKQAQSLLQTDRKSSSIHNIVNIPAQTVEEPAKRGFWARLFHWEPHHHAFRPLYRDDAFYEGKLKDLPKYQKSLIMDDPVKTGIEYHMEVTRAVAAHELQERRGVFTTAVRRVLATMMDPHLLKRKSYACLCLSGFCIYLGFLVPYVFLKERNIHEGLDPDQCTAMMSAIALSNAAGRLVLGSAASKICPLKLFAGAASVAGLSTMASSISFAPAYQFAYACVFGFCISSVPSLRSVVLVYLYGLDKLTNATGFMLIFLGLGSLCSTPIAGVLKDKSGSYVIPFYTAGAFMFIGGLIVLLVIVFDIKEKKAELVAQEETNKKREQQQLIKKKNKEKPLNQEQLDAQRYKQFKQQQYHELPTNK